MSDKTGITNTLSISLADVFSSLQISFGIGAIVIVVAIVAVGYFLREYIKAVALNLSTRENLDAALRAHADMLRTEKNVQKEYFDAAKDQLQQSTEIIKKIERQFDFEGWHSKEHNLLLRTKLEQLTFACDAAVNEAIDAGVILVNGDGKYSGTGEHLETVTSIYGLYFPELGPSCFALREAIHNYLKACRGVAFTRSSRIDFIAFKEKGIPDLATMLLLTAPTQLEADSTEPQFAEMTRKSAELGELTRKIMKELLPT